MHHSCVLAIERPGKKFLACDVGTYFALELALYMVSKQQVADNAKKLYERFGKDDKGEVECTAEEILAMPGNARIIIPATKDRFLYFEEWQKGNMKCPWPMVHSNMEAVKCLQKYR